MLIFWFFFPTWFFYGGGFFFFLSCASVPETVDTAKQTSRKSHANGLPEYSYKAWEEQDNTWHLGSMPLRL